MLDEEIVRKHWFPNHRAELITMDDGVQLLDWSAPDTGIYGIYYMINKRGRLIVTGDCYDAIYSWGGSKIDLNFLAGLNLGYFASKCTASQHGRLGETWYSDVAKKTWDAEVKDAMKDMSESDKLELESTYEYTMENVEDYMSSEMEWYEFMTSNPDVLIHLFGDEYWRTVDGIGRSICISVQGHLIGLKMAHEQIIEAYENKEVIG